MLNKAFFFSMMFLSCFIGLYATEKMYIDEEDFTTKGDAFHIHVGNNVWLTTSTVHRDETGLFSYECNIKTLRNGFSTEYKKTWKCPYCYQYWPIGTPCKNSECPSRYKS